MLFNFKKHNQMWDYIITHPKIPKKDVYYILFGDDAPEIPNYCFACNAVYDQFCKIRCEHCPLGWAKCETMMWDHIFSNCNKITAPVKPCMLSWYGKYIEAYREEDYDAVAYYALLVRKTEIKKHWRILDNEWALCDRHITCL